MKIKLTILLFIFAFSIPLTSKSQIIDADDLNTNCIACAQFVPDCKPNEKLIFQTCKECAHCEPIDPQTSSTCHKCTFHFQCSQENICKDTCCTPKYKLTDSVESTKFSIKGKSCPVACGLKCCKSNEKCVTVNQCIGKPSCNLPLLRYCSVKNPEKLYGKLVP